MNKASVVTAIRAAVPSMRQQFRQPTDQVVAECLVFYDALALHGYRNELDELRDMKDPVGFVQSTLKGK